ncbi:MAG: YbhB/YbcL family Raf kinase inhibitor-like protein [Caulobacteraceae bacterium]
MRVVLALVLGFVFTGCARAQPAVATLRLTSPAIGADGVIARRQSAYGTNLSPALTWTKASGAQAYAIVLDDPDAGGGRPFVHWTIWNIPAAATSLPEGLPATARLKAPSGAMQGINDAGGIGYFGPRPPSGVHHYRIQIFALSAPLNLAPGARREALTAAMRDRVLAHGETAGAFAAP